MVVLPLFETLKVQNSGLKQAFTCFCVEPWSHQNHAVCVHPRINQALSLGSLFTHLLLHLFDKHQGIFMSVLEDRWDVQQTLFCFNVQTHTALPQKKNEAVELCRSEPLCSNQLRHVLTLGRWWSALSPQGPNCRRFEEVVELYFNLVFIWAQLPERCGHQKRRAKAETFLTMCIKIRLGSAKGLSVSAYSVSIITWCCFPLLGVASGTWRSRLTFNTIGLVFLRIRKATWFF